MTKRVLCALMYTALSGACLAAESPALMLSGEVYAVGTQALLTPPSRSSPVVLRSFIGEGETVKAGDVVLSIDGGSAANSIREVQSQFTLAQAGADKQIAELEVKAVDAERALRTAEATLAKARIDAAIPRIHLSALDYDRYQGELTRAERELILKQAEWQAAQQAIGRRRQDATLELGQLQTRIDYWRTQVGASELRAERDGIVIHGFDTNRGQRYDEGSSSYPGQRVGEIVDAGERLKLGVRAWALDVDRPSLSTGQSVTVSFDALAGASVPARIGRIAGAPQAKAEWGDGRYFEVEIEVDLPAAYQTQLRPGSSARIRDSDAPRGDVSTAAPERRFEGEIVALDASAVAPPVIGMLWMMTLTQLVPDGTPVQAGQVVAAFDGNELLRQLNSKRSSLNEKRTQLERLQLELGERARAEAIATAEQRARLNKAQRKAQQPESLIAAMEYKKLVADRRLAEIEMELLTRREQLAARQRVAEAQQLDAELADLQSDVSELESGLAKLNVTAPRAGVMLHLSNFQGEKFDIGAQVFRGQAVAQIPELSKLAVRMQVPERQIAGVHLGQLAKVDVEGGALPTLGGRVAEIGRVVRSKSRVKPVPVVDVNIQLDALPEGAKLKPGQPVRVELSGADT